MVINIADSMLIRNIQNIIKQHIKTEHPEIDVAQINIGEYDVVAGEFNVYDPNDTIKES